MKTIEVHPRAQREADTATDYLRRKGMTPVGRFLKDLYGTLESIRLTPKMGTPYLQRFRLVKLERYNYIVYYEQVTEKDVYVFAIAHGSRKPGYWLRRTRRK